MKPFYFYTLLLFSLSTLFQEVDSQNIETPTANTTCPQNETLINGTCHCLPPRIRQDGLCQVVTCSDYYYFDWGTLQCEPCSPYCQTCYGKNPNQCLECDDSIESPIYHNAFTGVCEPTCTSGFPIESHGFKQCAYQNCDTEYAFIDTKLGACVKECPPSESDVMGNEHMQICGLCDKSCGKPELMSCMIGDPSICLICAEGYFPLITSTFAENIAVSRCINEETRPLDTILLPNSDQGPAYYYCDYQCKYCSGAPDICVTCPYTDWFLLPDGTCEPKCPSGTIPDYDNPTESGYITCTSIPAQSEKPITDYLNIGGTVVTASVAALQLLKPESSSAASTILLVNLLEYIRHLSIQYPPKLHAAFLTGWSLSLNFGPKFPVYLNEDVENSPSPSRFSIFDVNGLFLANFWSGVTTSAILILCVCFILLIMRIPLKSVILIKVRDRLKSFLVWNYMITFSLSNLDAVITFAIVEYQSLNLGSAISIASLTMNIIFFSFSLLLLAYIPYQVYRISKKDGSIEEKIKVYDSIKVIFEEVKHKHFLQEIALFLVGLRALLHNVIIAAFDSPAVQCPLLVTISVLMLVYSYGFRPYDEMIDNLELIAYETLIFIVNATCLYFSTLKSSEQINADTAGNVIIVCNMIALSLSILFSAIKLIAAVIKIIKPYLKNKVRSKASSAEIYNQRNTVKHEIPKKQEEAVAIEQENNNKKDASIQSIDQEFEDNSNHVPNKISCLHVNPSYHIVDTKKFPSLGITEEQQRPRNSIMYFSEKSVNLGSMSDLKIGSKNQI